MYATGITSRLIAEASSLLADTDTPVPETEIVATLNRLAQVIAGRDATTGEIHDVQHRGAPALESFIHRLEWELLRQLEPRAS